MEGSLARIEDGSLVADIRCYYRTCRNQICTANTVLEEFRTTAGVRQGDILSPYLFIISMDDIMKDCKQHTRDFTMGNWKMRPVQISEMAFADDVALIVKTEQNLQFNVDVWQEEMSRRNMDINVQKTEDHGDLTKSSTTDDQAGSTEIGTSLEFQIP
jgi:hypothetical protein